MRRCFVLSYEVQVYFGIIQQPYSSTIRQLLILTVCSQDRIFSELFLFSPVHFSPVAAASYNHLHDPIWQLLIRHGTTRLDVQSTASFFPLSSQQARPAPSFHSKSRFLLPSTPERLFSVFPSSLSSLSPLLHHQRAFCLFVSASLSLKPLERQPCLPASPNFGVSIANAK